MENNMTLELSHTERRVILQGIWKEGDMYSKMKRESKDDYIVLYAENMLKTLDKLENKLLGW
jgi:hypothetical protein